MGEYQRKRRRNVALEHVPLFSTCWDLEEVHLGEVFQEVSGAGTRSRTRDLLITNQLLYQLSYAGTVGDAMIADTADISSVLGSHFSVFCPLFGHCVLPV